MTMLSTWRHGLENAWESLAGGWREMSDRASSALTRFRRSADKDDAGDAETPAFGNWGLLAADVYDDEDKVVVRVEAPGMKREDFEIELHDDLLVVQGRKRFERESGSGSYRMVQCAYGSFHRTVPLPAPVKSDRTKASYRDGVLRIELPKADEAKARRIEVKVS
ncbi:MAG TPA: Hsp20/alpha crystallin family protein [Burkholderiaceae bacterium]|nr:Hsp20/alpha crystallin family protein [Burkholderiaceae bacterium]